MFTDSKIANKVSSNICLKVISTKLKVINLTTFSNLRNLLNGKPLLVSLHNRTYPKEEHSKTLLLACFVGNSLNI